VTKKDYILIAEALASAYDTAQRMYGTDTKVMGTHQVTVEAISRMLASDNPKFRPGYFREYIVERLTGHKYPRT